MLGEKIKGGFKKWRDTNMSALSAGLDVSAGLIGTIDSPQKLQGFLTSEKSVAQAMGGPAAAMERLDMLQEGLRTLKLGSDKDIKYIGQEGKKKVLSGEGRTDQQRVADIDQLESEKEKLQMQVRLGAFNENATSDSLSNTVRPPIMNYWNNRWVL